MRVAVLAGGRSSEHPVSLESAKSVLTGLEEAGHETVPIVIDRQGRWRTGDPRANGTEGERVGFAPGEGLLGADVAFPVLHGPFGEDGTVQGLLECLDVPYVGAGVLASALCIDKAAFKRLMAQAGMPQVRYEVVTTARLAAGPRACARTRARARAPELREARPPRVERRDLQGERGGRAAGERSRRPSSTTLCAWWRRLRSARRSSAP